MALPGYYGITEGRWEGGGWEVVTGNKGVKGGRFAVGKIENKEKQMVGGFVSNIIIETIFLLENATLTCIVHLHIQD